MTSSIPLPTSFETTKLLATSNNKSLRGAGWGRPTTDNTQSKHDQLVTAAKEFEALYVTQFLKQARQSTLSDPLINEESSETFRSMMDSELARSATSGLNLGIADAMVKQLSGTMTMPTRKAFTAQED
ncbi:MAG: Rod binding domain-containing protein [Paracoccaceae bacterium]|jgi:Rod binding domain-containing protein